MIQTLAPGRADEAVKHSGLCRTGSYGVDAHAEARGLERRGLRHAFDGVLAGSVDGCAGRSFVPIDRRDVDDAAAPLSLHHAQLMLHAEQRPEHIGVEGGGIGVGGLLRHRTGLAFGAGVVDGRVQPTKARDGPIDQVPHLVLVAHVRAQEFGVSAERAQLSREFLAGGLVATSDNDSVAFPREGQRRRTPNSSERAGDQDHWGVHIPAPSHLAGPEGRRMKTFTPFRCGRPRSGSAPLVYFVGWCHTSEAWDTLWNYAIFAFSSPSPRKVVSRWLLSG